MRDSPYTADAEVFSVTGLYNFDSYAFYNNYVDILSDGNKGIEAPTPMRLSAG